ncbi:transcriptional regulator, BadM/Rrf2 family [Verrucomicrobium sp. GAS474]|uniref:RrF2 family transcriptional regulator n=1 Tax=Verrucomicrobium sp. GAS474 TaxID=1882831 RepID=UPI00087C2B6D|nr:Rrf2 family transcriptional regulator [Verrucomicrobium sp. GAS474]SDU06275.1 transcriptional regulator, BadM/Rrf2 family [Verrucomicrobium sp. GAS474]
MLTKRGKYALRAVLYLGRHRDRGPILIQEIAEQEQIPKKFLEAILRDLRNEGILQSKMGKGGGYLLAQPTTRISLGDVIRTIDGPLAPIPCASQTAYAPCSDCPTVDTCMIRIVMRDVRDASSKILDGTSLQDALDRSTALDAETKKTLHFDI